MNDDQIKALIKGTPYGEILTPILERIARIEDCFAKPLAEHDEYLRELARIAKEEEAKRIEEEIAKTTKKAKVA